MSTLTSLEKIVLGRFESKAKKHQQGKPVKGLLVSDAAAEIGITVEEIRDVMRGLKSNGWLNIEDTVIDESIEINPGFLCITATGSKQVAMDFEGEGKQPPKLSIELNIPPLLEIGGWTYHRLIDNDPITNAHTLRIIENHGGPYERVAFIESAIETFDGAAELADKWLKNREEMLGYEWRADRGDGEILFSCDVTVTPASLLQFSVNICDTPVPLKDTVKGVMEGVVWQESDGWDKAHDVILKVVQAIIDFEATQIEPATATKKMLLHEMHDEALQKAADMLSVQPIYHGGKALGWIPGPVEDLKYVCARVWRGDAVDEGQGPVEATLLLGVKPDPESKLKLGKEGHSLTGDMAFGYTHKSALSICSAYCAEEGIEDPTGAEAETS